MKRLFWALGLDRNPLEKGKGQIEKVKVAAKKRGLEAQWSPTENYHVTLVFLGDIEEDKIPPMIEKAKRAALDTAPFDLKLKGAGAFPSLSNGRVMYIGVQAKRDLMALQKNLYESLKSDFDLEKWREFVPHMTVGRLRSKRNLKDLLSPLEGKSFGKARAVDIVLYESSLAGAFPKYRPLRRIALNGESSDKNIGDEN